MPNPMTVESAQAETIGVTEVWRVVTRNASGGNGVTHIFPKAILDWRAAEYGIDPTDVDTLLDIVLHEPHMEVVADGGQARFADGSPALWDATSTDAAREAHLTRVKTCPVQVNVRGAAALATIRAGYVPDLERIREMREAVDTTRWLKKYGDLPRQPIPQIPAVKEARSA